MATLGSALAQTPTPVSTIEESIATLREMIAGVENGSTMVIAPLGANSYDGMFTVEKERVGMIGGWMVASGQLDPDSVESWTRKQIELSRGALVVMKRQLADYEAGRDGPTIEPEPPVVGSVGLQPVYWPSPMDWREVGGIVRGTYTIQCYSTDENGRPRRLSPTRGTFKLELRGKGVVLGSFTDTDDAISEEINGTVSEVGVAGGSVVNEWARTTWSVEFERSGNDIRITNPELIMAPDVKDMRCDPGVVVQT
jgi:hypothetical protein